jgi:hypothetical protein
MYALCFSGCLAQKTTAYVYAIQFSLLSGAKLVPAHALSTSCAYPQSYLPQMFPNPVRGSGIRVICT